MEVLRQGLRGRCSPAHSEKLGFARPCLRHLRRVIEREPKALAAVPPHGFPLDTTADHGLFYGAAVISTTAYDTHPCSVCN